MPKKEDKAKEIARHFFLSEITTGVISCNTPPLLPSLAAVDIQCGNWLELNKEPGQALPPGFPHAMYKTDAQQQMLEGVLMRPKR